MTNRIARSVHPTYRFHSSASAPTKATNGTATAIRFALRCATLSCVRPTRRIDWFTSATGARIRRRWTRRPALGRRDLLVEAAQTPGRVDRVQEVRRADLAQAIVVVVVLQVAGRDGDATGADRAAEVLRYRPVDRQRSERGAAVVVVDDERVAQGEDRRVDADVRRRGTVRRE